jgi:ketosteroid isomerase-like protein
VASPHSSGTLPPEGERLLAVSPEDFVPERNRVVRELKDAGRAEDAQTVAALKKPSAVVLAVNRAARDRSAAARDAVKAAERVRKTQLAGKPDQFEEAIADLERALGLLADVAVAMLSRGKSASEAMRRRVSDLLRAALAGEDSREALARGVLVEELEASGFSSFEGMAVPQRRGGRSPKTSRGHERRRAREERLREELAGAEATLRDAEQTLADAVKERDRATRAVDAARSKLDRL